MMHKSIKDLWPNRELHEVQAENRLLAISYRYGEMDVYLEKLFPCELSRLRGILKLVDEDYDRREALLEQMATFCDASIQQMEDIIRGKATQYVDLRTEAAEMIPSVKKENDRVEYLRKVHASKTEIKMAQATAGFYRETAREATHCASDIKRCQAMLEKLKKNAEVIDKWKS